MAYTRVGVYLCKCVLMCFVCMHVHHTYRILIYFIGEWNKPQSSGHFNCTASVTCGYWVILWEPRLWRSKSCDHDRLHVMSGVFRSQTSLNVLAHGTATPTDPVAELLSELSSVSAWSTNRRRPAAPSGYQPQHPLPYAVEMGRRTKESPSEMAIPWSSHGKDVIF